MMFLFLVLTVLPLLALGWNFNVYWYPLLSRADWYGGTALLNADSSDEMSDSRNV